MVTEVRRRGEGCWILDFHGDFCQVPRGMEALVAYDERDLPCGYLLYEPCAAGAGPRPWYTSGYLFLHSAWVCETDRGSGVFTRLTARLRRLHPRTAIVGMAVDSTGAVDRFFRRCERMPGRQPAAA